MLQGMPYAIQHIALPMALVDREVGIDEHPTTVLFTSFHLTDIFVAIEKEHDRLSLNGFAILVVDWQPRRALTTLSHMCFPEAAKNFLLLAFHGVNLKRGNDRLEELLHDSSVLPETDQALGALNQHSLAMFKVVPEVTCIHLSPRIGFLPDTITEVVFEDSGQGSGVCPHERPKTVKHTALELSHVAI